jgi:hypothetical protein
MKAAGRTMTVVEMLDALAGAHPLTPVWIGEGDPVVEIEVTPSGVRLEAEHWTSTDAEYTELFDGVKDLFKILRKGTKAKKITDALDAFNDEWGIEL